MFPVPANAVHCRCPHISDSLWPEGEQNENIAREGGVILKSSETLPWTTQTHTLTHTCILTSHITPFFLTYISQPPSQPAHLAHRSLMGRGRPCGSNIWKFTQWPFSPRIPKQRREKHDLMLKQCSQNLEASKITCRAY
jgi:hypothetical protein